MNKTIFTLMLLFTFMFGYSQNEKLEKYKVNYIKSIISSFKNKNIDSIAAYINFPLKREYPIPSIKNKKEFILRFNEVFDGIIVNKITNSKIKQWSEAGYRGIMLDNGLVWIDSDEGKITAVLYQSDFENKLRQKLITEEKENIHLSLKNFETPIYKITTKNYLIRIDELSDGNYRYASWKINEKESSKPDLILNNGKRKYLGSSENHVITFSDENYTYKIYRNFIGEDDAPDITLEIEKNKEIILSENGTLVLD